LPLSSLYLHRSHGSLRAGVALWQVAYSGDSPHADIAGVGCARAVETKHHHNVASPLHRVISARLQSPENTPDIFSTGRAAAWTCRLFSARPTGAEPPPRVRGQCRARDVGAWDWPVYKSDVSVASSGRTGHCSPAKHRAQSACMRRGARHSAQPTEFHTTGRPRVRPIPVKCVWRQALTAAGCSHPPALSSAGLGHCICGSS
jgi:hypothetical protein